MWIFYVKICTDIRTDTGHTVACLDKCFVYEVCKFFNISILHVKICTGSIRKDFIC